jgi:hypothetical protein
MDNMITTFKIFEGETTSAIPSIVQKDDKGYFLFKAQFDAIKPKNKDKKYRPVIAWRFADDNK